MTLNLPRLRELLQAGTSLPWSVEMSDEKEPRVIGVYGPMRLVNHGLGAEQERDRIIETDYGNYEPDKPDADLIVSAVNALPHLLAICEAALAFHDSPCTCGDERSSDDLCKNGLAEIALFAAIDAARKAP